MSEMLFLEPDLCRHNNYTNLACSYPEYYTTKATSTISIICLCHFCKIEHCENMRGAGMFPIAADQKLLGELPLWLA